MLVAIAAVATPPQQRAQASVRIVRAQRVTKREWERSTRRREIVVREGERKIVVRVIEFE